MLHTGDSGGTVLPSTPTNQHVRGTIGNTVGVEIPGEAWTFLGVFVVQAFGFAAIWVKLHATNDAADEAVKLSRPTGNGWAKEVLHRFDGLTADIAHLRGEVASDRHAMTAHLNDHAAVSVLRAKAEQRARDQRHDG
jgi:hypothetical protein